MPSVSIYVSKKKYEEAVAESIKTNTSISSVLVGYPATKDVVDPTAMMFDRISQMQEQLDRIESALKLLSPKGMPRGLADGRRAQAVYPSEPQEDLNEPELQAANDRLKQKRAQAGLDKSREKLERKKGETSAAWLIRKKAHAVRGNNEPAGRE